MAKAILSGHCGLPKWNFMIVSIYHIDLGQPIYKEVSDNVEATPSKNQQPDYMPRMQQLVATVKNVTERAHEQAPR